MTTKFIPQLVAASILFSAGPAGIAEALPVVAPGPNGATVVQLADFQSNSPYHMHNRMDWQSQSHGNRCLTRMGNCRHYHQGYYYQTPWWVVPMAVGGAIAGASNDHVQWCLSHHHSYSPRTDMWVESNGRHIRCNSGY